LGEQAMSPAALAQALRMVTERQPLVVLKADRAAAHGLVVSALDAIRQAGLRRVSMQTQPAEVGG
jgi:biopolymer transport protein ExbD